NGQLEPSPQFAPRASFFPDGKHAYTNSLRIRSASADRKSPTALPQTVVWEIATGRRLYAVTGSALGHSPDGKYLLTVATDELPEQQAVLNTGTQAIRFREVSEDKGAD